jgi:drug/metabolite transporter (DMT)-like permease
VSTTVQSESCYTLVLWAITQAPVATVAAPRETAILFGTAMSALLLRERFGWTRYASAVVIVFGAITLKLA